MRTNTNNCKSAKQVSEHRRGGLCVYIITTISIIIYLYIPSLFHSLHARSAWLVIFRINPIGCDAAVPRCTLHPIPLETTYLPILLPNIILRCSIFGNIITVIREYFGRCRRAGYTCMLGGVENGKISMGVSSAASLMWLKYVSASFNNTAFPKLHAHTSTRKYYYRTATKFPVHVPTHAACVWYVL